MSVVDDHSPNPATNFWGYLLEEDNALRTLLSGMKVTDLQHPNGQIVPVWFRWPQREEQARTFPYITIRFLSQEVAHEREHRGTVEVGYEYLQNVPFYGSNPPMMNYPIPMDLHYEITTNARENQHHAQMIGALTASALNPRYGVLVCSGGTTRRLQVDSSVDASGIETLESGKRRLFRQIWRITVPTELEPDVFMGSRVTEIDLTVKDTGSSLTWVVAAGTPDEEGSEILAVGPLHPASLVLAAPAGTVNLVPPIYVGPLFPARITITAPAGTVA